MLSISVSPLYFKLIETLFKSLLLSECCWYPFKVNVNLFVLSVEKLCFVSPSPE